MLYFECPACKANCETTDAFAGKTVHCPHCGKSVTVPADPAAVTTTPPKPKPKPKPAPASTASTAIATPELATAQQTSAPSIAQDSSGNQLRNVILVLLGVAVLVGLGIWLIPAESSSSPAGGMDVVDAIRSVKVVRNESGEMATPVQDVIIKSIRRLAPEDNAKSGSNPVVVIETSMGAIKIELSQDKAPITVANFLRYVDDKHFDGTIFHRVIADFMIQGGGFEPGMRPKESKYPPIKNEAGNGLSNIRGTIAMARTTEPNSATDQFFINVADNRGQLDRSPAIRMVTQSSERS